MAYIVIDPIQLIDSSGSGLALDAAAGVALVANQRGFIGLAYDGTNVQYIRSTTGGVLLGTPDPQIDIIKNAATITVTGSQVVTGVGSRDIDLVWNLKSAPTGTSPTIQFSIVDIDPVDQTTTVGTAVSSSVLNAVGAGAITLSSNSSAVKVTWTVTGTGSPTFTNVNLTLLQKNTVAAGGGGGGGTVAQGTAAALAGAWPFELTDGTHGPVAVKAASIAAVAADSALVVSVSPNNVVEVGSDTTATYSPDPGNFSLGVSSPLSQDGNGNLAIRGPVITDEGSFRTDFTVEGTASSFATTLTGTAQFVNGSTNVVGSGTTFTTQVKQGQWIKLSADPETDYAQVAFINSDTSITLSSTYGGTSSTAATVVSNWATVTPSGGSLVFGTSVVGLSSGTTANATGYIRSLADSQPLSVQFYLSVSNVFTNVNHYWGLQDIGGKTPNQFARFVTTTSTSTVQCVVGSSSAAADQQSSTITFASNGLISGDHLYKIDLSDTQVTFSIDGLIVAQFNIHLPGPYQPLYQIVGVFNGGTGPAGSTSSLVDVAFFENIDRLQIDNDFVGEPLPIQGSQTIASLQTLPVVDAQTQRATYSAATIAFTAAATPTDIFAINGSATKIIRVTRIEIIATQTTAGYVAVQLLKRSTANTGGTSTFLTAVPHDSGSPGFTASIQSYTVNPTALGAVVGSAVRTTLLWTPATTAIGSIPFVWDFSGARGIQPIVLRGAAQQLSINLNSVTHAGNSFTISIEWTEDIL